MVARMAVRTSVARTSVVLVAGILAVVHIHTAVVRILVVEDKVGFLEDRN